MGDIVSAKDFLSQDENPTSVLVDRLLWERDNVILVGSEKVGKSILALQLAFALTSKQPFLGEYPVSRECSVLYVQAEGKKGDTRDRIRSMMQVNDVNLDKLFIAYYPSLGLNTMAGLDVLVENIEEIGVKPEVIILDPLYQLMRGSLSDEEDARAMTANLRKLGELYNATIVLTHHTHKPIRTKEGDLIEEGDDAVFGSFVWKAWADHTLLFRMTHGKMRVLSCSTQRSGRVLDKDELTLTDKPYLAFDRRADAGAPFEQLVKRTLDSVGEKGATREQLIELTGLSLTSVEKSLRKMIQVGEARKDQSHRPVRYWLVRVAV